MKEQVLEIVDIVDVIGERVSLRRQGRDFVGLCPFHDDHRPSMSVSPKKQIFKCWSCGAGGDVIKFVQLRDRVPFPEALASLARRAGLEARSTPEARRSAGQREQLLRAMEWARDHFVRNLRSTAGQAAREYAAGRGLTDETIERCGIGFAPDRWDDLLEAARRVQATEAILQQAGLVASNEQGRTYDRFRNRLIFPIRDGLGRVVAFGGRTLGDDSAKYLNSPETPLFSKSRILYGLDLARSAIEQQRVAIVVEGYLDAALLHQYGFPHSVATLGTALTEAHMKLLRPLADKVVLCFDADQAGARAADRALETALRSRVAVGILTLPDGQDPADCLLIGGGEGFAALLPTAVDALEFKWALTLRALDDGSARSRREAVEEFISFIAGLSDAGGIDPLEQGLLVGRLAEVLSLPADSVYELLAGARSRSRRPTSMTTPDSSAASTYDTAIRALPAGVVAAIETLFGCVLADAQWLTRAGAAFEAATATCDAWRRLHGIMRDLAGADGLSRAAVVQHCDAAELCELVSRAVARVPDGSDLEAVAAAAQERLQAEFDAQRMSDLSGHVRDAQVPDAGRDEAFRSLIEVGRRQQAVLPAARRWPMDAAS